MEPGDLVHHVVLSPKILQPMQGGQVLARHAVHRAKAAAAALHRRGEQCGELRGEAAAGLLAERVRREESGGREALPGLGQSVTADRSVSTFEKFAWVESLKARALLGQSLHSHRLNTCDRFRGKQLCWFARDETVEYVERYTCVYARVTHRAVIPRSRPSGSTPPSLRRSSSAPDVQCPNSELKAGGNPRHEKPIPNSTHDRFTGSIEVGIRKGKTGWRFRAYNYIPGRSQNDPMQVYKKQIVLRLSRAACSCAMKHPHGCVLKDECKRTCVWIWIQMDHKSRLTEVSIGANNTGLGQPPPPPRATRLVRGQIPRLPGGPRSAAAALPGRTPPRPRRSGARRQSRRSE